MLRPTFRAAALVGLSVPLAAAIAVGAPEFWIAVPTLLGVVFAAFVLDVLQATRRVAIAAEIPDPLNLGGTPQTAIFRLSAPRLPRRIAAALDVTAPLEAQPEKVFLAPEGARTVEITFPLAAARRGAATVERLWLSWTGPLGLARVVRIEGYNRPVRVTPDIHAVRSAALTLRLGDSIFGQKVDRLEGQGSEVRNLRDYVAGFDPRSIHWKQSARHRRLVCREFQVERNHNVIVAIDAGHVMCEPLGRTTKLDRAINAGLLLSYVALQAGDRVGMFSFAAKPGLYVPPGATGPGAFRRLQLASATIPYSNEETNYALALTHLQARLAHRGLIVLFTDFVDTVTAELMVDILARMARRHLVLFVTLKDPILAEAVDRRPSDRRLLAEAVVADEIARERRIVFDRLSALGVQCLEAPHEAAAQQAVERYLALTAREMI